MLITGIVLMVVGVLLFWFGWLLNTQTPIQQPLPAVGVGIVFVGLVLALLAL